MIDSLNILIVEDDPALGDSLEEYLSAKGHSVTWLRDERGIEAHSLRAFQVVVLDLILQFIPGEQILGRIRHEAPELPVLVLTAKAGLGNKQVCFEAGADDYLTKPFEPMELLLRIQALCKRDAGSAVHRCGEVEIDLGTQLVYRNGEEVRLSGRAWDLLRLLLQNRGAVVGKETIMDQVWSDAVVTDNVIRYYIKELRRVFPEGSIETYKGRGYRLV
jgi:DNA-binding response OmpR family regulator